MVNRPLTFFFVALLFLIAPSRAQNVPSAATVESIHQLFIDDQNEGPRSGVLYQEHQRRGVARRAQVREMLSKGEGAVRSFMMHPIFSNTEKRPTTICLLIYWLWKQLFVAMHLQNGWWLHPWIAFSKASGEPKSSGRSMHPIPSFEPIPLKSRSTPTLA